MRRGICFPCFLCLWMCRLLAELIGKNCYYLLWQPVVVHLQVVCIQFTHQQSSVSREGWKKRIVMEAQPWITLLFWTFPVFWGWFQAARIRLQSCEPSRFHRLRKPGRVLAAHQLGKLVLSIVCSPYIAKIILKTKVLPLVFHVFLLPSDVYLSRSQFSQFLV